MPTFNEPSSGDFLDFDELNGSLLLFTVLEEQKGINTTFGAKDAIIADVVVLDGDQAGTMYEDSMVFPLVLRAQLKRSIGEMVLGRLTTGTAKPGQKAPWTLTAATDADKAVATAFVEKHGTPAEAKVEKAAAANKPF